MIDERLEALGARRIAPRGEGDAREDLDGQFQDWFKKLWPQVGKALGARHRLFRPGARPSRSMRWKSISERGGQSGHHASRAPSR